LDGLALLAGQVVGSSAAPSELTLAASALADSLGSLKSRIADLQATVAHLVARFGKNTVTIGVAGKARQGKSTLLQAISGLDDAVIPTSDGLPCTGAKSRILHQEQNPHAVIEFYSEEEFVQGIVYAYFDELGFTPRPASLTDFRRPLPALSAATPEQHAIYQKLQEMHAGLGEFGRYLSHRTGKVALDKVRDFVSQEHGRRWYMAVKCAHIYVRFPNQDVTGLSVVDLPGLGEVAQGHGQRLAASLQQEVDAILLLKLPSAEGTLWDRGDYEVFNRIKQAVPELDLSDWLFPVLNETGQNARQVELLQRHAPDVGSPLSILSANCKDPSDVDRRVFAVVLHHLQANLGRIDQKHLTSLASQLADLAGDLEAAVKPARAFFRKDKIPTDDELRFDDLFNKFLEQLRGSLELLVDSYRRNLPEESNLMGSLVRRFRKAPSDHSENESEFQAAVREACDSVDRSPPLLSVGELRAQFFDKGGWKAVLQEQLHHLRSHLTHELAKNMDARLARMAQDVQRQMLGGILAEPLIRVLPEAPSASSDPRSQILALRQLLSDHAQRALAAALDYVLSFTFSYQSHFHYRVRRVMDRLDPMTAAGRVNPASEKADAAEAVAADLAARYHKVVANVRAQLSGELQTDPLRAIFAMVEETRDRLVRARSIEREWRSFLYPRRGDIWPADFSQFAAESARCQEWQSALDTAVQLAEKLRGLVYS
jgi:hypothetical protein